MPTDYGQIYGQGVKYLKVNRYDSGGMDRSDYLGQLTNLTINYDDLGSISYNIVTTQEQDNYYIYGIETQNQVTESINFNVLDYSFTAVSSSTFTVDINADNLYDIRVGSYGSTTGNSLGYFTASSGDYYFHNTPNKFLKVKISASYTIGGGGPARPTFFVAANDNNSTLSDAPSLQSAGGPYLYEHTFILSSSGFPSIENEKLGFGLFSFPFPNVMTCDNFEVSLSLHDASVNQASSSLTIFNPEFIDWDYNDYNVLLGNAEIPQYSSKFMDVDYTSTFTKPVNFELILSGTADRAQVQDSNYSSYAWSGIRYWGNRYNSYKSSTTKFNTVEGATEGNFNDPSIDGSGYGSLPAVEQNETFMAYFDGVGGTGPEIIGQTAHFIKYIIDENGNITNPEPNTVALYNLLDSYESGKNAIVRLISNDPLVGNVNSDSLTGIHKITNVGRITPILITETGSGNMDYITTMSFANTNGSLLAQATQNITAKYQSNISPTFISNTDWNTMSYQNDLYSINWAESPSSNNWKLINYSTLEAGTRIRIRVSFYLKKASAFSNYFQFRILKNSDQDNIFFTSEAFNITSTDGQYINATTDWFDTEQDDYFTVQYRVATGGTSYQLRLIGSGGDAADTTFTVEQETPIDTGFINGITGATSSYWSIGNYTTGSNFTVLTASNALYDLYTAGNLMQSTPEASSDFGFTTISTPFFPILPGDYIRFEYNENRKHCITEVSDLDGLHLTVVPPIATSSILDHFVLYRIVNDGTYIILNVDKPDSGNSFTGIIQPEYISQTLKNNYNDIIQNLTQKNLIS